MPLTRIAAETSIRSTIGDYTLEVSRFRPPDETTGLIAELGEVLARTLGQFGIVPVDRGNLGDADIAPLPDGLQARFLDLAGILTLESCRDRCVLMPSQQMWRDYQVYKMNFMTGLNAAIAAKWANYRATYFDSGAPSVGRMCPESQNQLTDRPFFPFGY